MVRRAPSHLDGYIDMVSRQFLQSLSALWGALDLSDAERTCAGLKNNSERA